MPSGLQRRNERQLPHRYEKAGERQSYGPQQTRLVPSVRSCRPCQRVDRLSRARFPPFGTGASPTGVMKGRHCMCAPGISRILFQGLACFQGFVHPDPWRSKSLAYKSLENESLARTGSSFYKDSFSKDSFFQGLACFFKDLFFKNSFFKDLFSPRIRFSKDSDKRVPKKTQLALVWVRV